MQVAEENAYLQQVVEKIKMDTYGFNGKGKYLLNIVNGPWRLQAATCKEFLQVRQEGARNVKCNFSIILT